MPDVHEVVAYVVVGLFGLGWLWGLGLWILRRGAGVWFWRWLAAAQIVAVVEVVIGLILLALGYRPSTWLHYVYGGGPLLILVIGHSLARDPSFESRPWVPFAFASFICFGLTLRALMTGLGIA